jgi:hypothetical protein
MDSILRKIADKGPTAEEQAAIDASIRTSRRSIGIRQMISEVRAAQARGLAPHEIQVELARWAEEYPRLFAMLLDPECSEATLNAMLAQLEAVELGGRSAHEASVAVGTVLVNSYVRPRLGMEQVPLPGSGAQSARPSGRGAPSSRGSGARGTKPGSGGR